MAQDLPIPEYDSLEPVYGGDGDYNDATAYRYKKLKERFIAIYGHAPSVYARSPG